MKYNNNPLRQLAKSDYWQILYNQSKEINIKIFENIENLSYLQVNFLQWLNLYKRLNEEMYSGDELLNKEIINDDISIDAYLYYKKHYKKEEYSQVQNFNTDIPKIVFNRKRKK